MGRPTEYTQPRVDTKIRLRADHAEALKEEQVERGIGRNRLLEIILDGHYHPSEGVAPRLAKADPGKPLGGPAAKGKGRHTPRLAQIGKGIEEKSREKQDAVTPTFKEAGTKARVQPRSRRVTR